MDKYECFFRAFHYFTALHSMQNKLKFSKNKKES